VRAGVPCDGGGHGGRRPDRRRAWEAMKKNLIERGVSDFVFSTVSVKRQRIVVNVRSRNFRKEAPLYRQNRAQPVTGSPLC
jgi:hypothetical protein